MKRHWLADELVEFWSMPPDELGDFCTTPPKGKISKLFLEMC